MQRVYSWVEKESVAICSCNDDIRPVIFKIEKTDEEYVIDYKPIKQIKMAWIIR